MKTLISDGFFFSKIVWEGIYKNILERIWERFFQISIAIFLLIEYG